jgi:hypothetical protein
MADGRIFHTRDTSALAGILAAFDKIAMQNLGVAFATAVARDVARRIDLHHGGIEPQSEDACPLAESVDLIRAQVSKGSLDCRMAVHLADDAIYFRFHEGERAYAPILLQDNRIRETETAPPASSLRIAYRLVRGRLPSPKWTSVRRRLPGYDARLIAAESTAIRSGALPLTRARQILEERLPREIGQGELQRYGRRIVAEMVREDPPGLVDHADIIETSDNKIFVAVMDAGFALKERIVIQIRDREFSFVQSGRDFGTVIDAPSSAVSLMRSTKHLTLVEMSRRSRGTKNRIKSTHVALVKDISERQDYAAIMKNWTPVVRKPNEKEDRKWPEI